MFSHDPATKAAKVAKAVDNVKEPIVVSADTLPAVLASVGRVLAILIAGFAMIIQLMSARDLMGVWVWLQTTDGAAFLATVSTVVAFGTSMYQTWKRHNKLIVLAATAPEDVGQIK